VALVLCWIVFPSLIGLLSLGLGLLVERAARTKLPAELLMPVGFAAMVCVALFATMTPATARLALPLVLAFAVVGLAASLPSRLPRIDPWAAAAALGIFAAFAAPVVLSGDATFAGYVKLDDTATFLALAERALEHGRSLEGLAASSYEATLAFNLPFYPLGSLLPLGIGSVVSGQDSAWIFQPYLAFLAALLGLSLYRLAGLVVASRPSRALAAFLAAQAALLYGYSLWGGVKEMAAAALVALAAALTSDAFNPRRGLMALLPLGIASAALVGVLSVGAVVWLIPVLGVVGIAVLRRRSRIRPLVVLAVGAALLVPSLAVARLMVGPGVLGSIRDGDELGNLVAALSPLQLLGIWPAGDFRFRPERMDVTYVLLAVLVAAAAVGILVAARRRAWELPLYLGTVLGAAVVYGMVTSPWIEAKAFAIAAPAFVLTASVGALCVLGVRRVEGAVLLSVIALGVAWSNALAFGDVSLAPRDQLAELEAIGKEFRGQGPALMTEYQPYGVRHFLRELDAEGASELRRRPIPLRNGFPLEKGTFADISEFDPGAVMAYRTLVLRRTPVGSAPPAPYRLVREHRFYEVWQRPDTIPVSASASRSCAAPLRLQGSTLTVPVSGEYDLWLAGSIRGELSVLLDGRLAARLRHHLNNAGQYTPLGRVALSAGPHTVETRERRSRIRPGERGEPWAYGPLLVTPAQRCA
jgi:hypothetical protein